MNAKYTRGTVRRCLVSWAVAATIPALTTIDSLCSADDVVNPAQVIAAWQQHEHAYENVCLSWRASLFQTDTTGQGDFAASLKMQSTKYRYDTSIFRKQAGGGLEFTPHVKSFDGERNYLLSTEGVRSKSIGSMQKANPRAGLASYGPLYAPTMVFRPFSSGLFDPNARLVIDSRRRESNQRACLTATFHNTNASVTKCVWVDAETLVPVRLEILRAGVPEVVVSLKFRGQPQPSLLDAWDYVISGYGRVIESGTAKTVKVDNTCVLTDADFRVAFPTGTRVVDRTSGREVVLLSRGAGILEPWSENAAQSTWQLWAIRVLSLLGVAALAYYAFCRFRKSPHASVR